MEDFFLGVFGIVAFIIVISGITNIVSNDRVTPAMFEQAIQLCKGNGGLKHLDMDVSYHDVYCNNNAEFSNSIKVSQK